MAVTDKPMPEDAPHFKAHINMNGNIMAAVDVETTGLDATKHDIIQIAVVPLDSTYRPNPNIAPFVYKIAPRIDRLKYVEKKANRVHGFDLADMVRSCPDCWTVSDRLVEWFDKLPLGMDKRLVPLGHNYSFDRQFIIEWLGPLSYDRMFSYHYRDSMHLALSINDACDIHAEPAAYTRYGLGDLCRFHKVENLKAHDALCDCLATAELYRRMICSIRKV